MKRLVYLLLSIVNAVSSAFSNGALTKRNLGDLICPGETVFAAGTSTTVNSLALSVQNDSYLQSFVAPIDGTLCALTFSITTPSGEVSARLDIYDNTTPQINVVNGIATPAISVSVFTSSNVLGFPFCSAEQSLISGSVYTMAISLKANSAPLSLNFGDSGAQGIFFGPSFGSQGQVQNVGLNFNLTAGTSKPSCSKPTTTITSTTSTVKPTQTTTTSTNTASATPVVYCKCRGVVRFDGHLQRRDLDEDEDDDFEDDEDDEDEDDLENEDIGLGKRGVLNRNIGKRIRPGSQLFKRSLSKYTVRFSTKCGKYTCRCRGQKLSENYISSNDLNFDSFGTC